MGGRSDLMTGPFVESIGVNLAFLPSDPIYVDSTVMTSSGGIIVPGYCHVLCVKVLIPGTAGNLTIWNTADIGEAMNKRFDAAFGSLTADQILHLGPKGTAKYMDTLYFSSLPTGGAVLVHLLPTYY